MNTLTIDVTFVCTNIVVVIFEIGFFFYQKKSFIASYLGRPRPKPFLNYVKHLEKICSVRGGHLTSMNFPLRNWEGYCAYSLRVGGKLCLLIGVRTLPLLRSRH
jgi:hypothetical protein